MHEFLCKILRFLPRFQQKHVFQNVEAFLRRLRITRSSFLKNKFRNAKLIVSATIVPPLFGTLLMPRDNHISTGAGRQVADERGFNVDSLRHGGSFLLRRFGQRRGMSDLILAIDLGPYKSPHLHLSASGLGSMVRNADAARINAGNGLEPAQVDGENGIGGRATLHVNTTSRIDS